MREGVLDIRITALEQTLRRLIAGVSVEITREPRGQASARIYSVSRHGITFELISGKPEFVFLLALQGAGRWRFRISRETPAFSKIEERLFGRLPKTLITAFGGTDGRDRGQMSQLGALLALDHLLVGQVLRRDVTGGYWTHLVILQSLIDLTFSRYEGNRATSGVVYSSQPELFLSDIDPKECTFGPFSPPHHFDQQFFASPASYRYVDGRNAFYLIDNRLQVQGVLRITRPDKYSLIDRCSGLHVQPLVRRMPGRAWCGFIGLNDDVQIRTAQGLALSWRANHWQVRDEGILAGLFAEAGLPSDIAEAVARTIQSMSELRKGALILVPDDDTRLPAMVGQIDTTALASLLNAQIEQANFLEMFKANTTIQVLSSDGITVISRSGRLLACGRIIDLVGVTGTAGGGRTQAATAASRFGLAVKISADGPISAFRNGVNILSL
jgi:hypothetical protein